MMIPSPHLLTVINAQKLAGTLIWPSASYSNPVAHQTPEYLPLDKNSKNDTQERDANVY